MNIERNFWEDLETQEKMWKDFPRELIYKKIFPWMTKMEVWSSGKCKSQKEGKDVRVVEHNRVIWCEEKMLKREYKQISFELWDNEKKHHPGWMANGLYKCDYLLYAFYPSRTVYAIDWKALVKVWWEKEIEWRTLAQDKKEGFDAIYTDNDKGYTSVMIAVPIAVLEKVFSKSEFQKFTL